METFKSFDTIKQILAIIYMYIPYEIKRSYMYWRVLDVIVCGIKYVQILR